MQVKFGSLALLCSMFCLLFFTGGCVSSQCRSTENSCHHGVRGTAPCNDCQREVLNNRNGWNCADCEKAGKPCGHCQRKPDPQPPVVITRDCGVNEGINLEPLVLNGTARFTIQQTATGTLEVVDCNGQVCKVDEKTVTGTKVVELPIQASANLHGGASVNAKPGEKPCETPAKK